jgi:hypothetical protein
MKVKNLILSLITFSFLVFSCTQEEIVPQSPNSSQETMELATMSTNTTSTTAPKAYIFIEPQSKTRLIVDYLKTKPLSTQRIGSTPFYGFFTSLRIQESNYTDLLHYIDMPYWYNGTFPSVIQSEIPQTTATEVDNFGNPLRQYNFKTIKINKGTLNEFGWVTILIPVSGMANDTKKQTKIGYYAMNGTRMVSSGNNTHTIINMNSTLYSFLLNYTGTRIPVGQYRVYSSYGGTYNRIRFNDVNDVYFRGASN